MSQQSYSFRHRDPNFQIPLGTQVVVRSDIVLPDGSTRKSGSVGRVAAHPKTNAEPYLVEFADGTKVSVSFADLSVRRREIDDELSRREFDLREYVIYRCQVGSRAFGLATPESDDDIRGIYLPPADLHWSLYRLPEQFEGDGTDEVYWELEKFVRLALKANPSILETMWTPIVLHADEVARRLIEIRDSFLSRHLCKTYSGYVSSQFRLMSKGHEQTGSYKSKHAMHLIRLLHSGIEVSRTGRILVDVGEYREELLDIRSGMWPFDKVEKRALELEAQFQTAYSETDLPEQPDFETVDEFLIWARRSRV